MKGPDKKTGPGGTGACSLLDSAVQATATRATSRHLAKFLVTVTGLVAKFDLDLHETVVLGDTVGPAEGTGLDLAAVGGNRNVGDSGVLSLAGAM